jgi:hypothetical protein
LAAIFPGKQLACFGTRDKHEEQQSHPVHELENNTSCRDVGGAEERFFRVRCKVAKDGWTKQNAGRNLTDDARLSEAGKQVSEDMSDDNENNERQDNRTELVAGHQRPREPELLPIQ